MHSMIRFKLSLMMFLEFFIWGAWFVTLGTYLSTVLSSNGDEISAAYSTQSLGAIIAPFIIGLIADLLFLGFALIISVNGWAVVERVAKSGQSSASIELPMFFIYAAMPTGFSLICVRLLQNMYAKIKSGQDVEGPGSFACPVNPQDSLPAASRSGASKEERQP